MVTRRVVFLVAVLGVGWWLFADTYARHAPDEHRGWHKDGGLRFAHFGTYQDYELWREVIAEFERTRSGIRVKQEYIVGLAGRYNTKMRQQILSHTLPDVALVQLGPFHELAAHFADLSSLLEDSFDADGPLEAALDATGLAAFQSAGRQRGLPVSGGNLLIYGNTECFERASRLHGFTIPLPDDDWTNEDFHRIARLLTCDFDGDGRIDQFGFWLPRWVYYLPFLWSFGAELTDEGLGEWRLVGPEAEQALDFYRDLAVGDPVCPRDDEVPELFQDVGFLTGKVALCVNGPWFMPFLAETRLAEGYFVAPIPRGKAGRATRITWDGVVMADGLPPKRRAAAWQFISLLLSKPVQDRIAACGRALPARRDSAAAFADSPVGCHAFTGAAHVGRRVPCPPARRACHSAGLDRRAEPDLPLIRAPSASAGCRSFVEALSYSRLQPLLPRFGEVDGAINEHLGHLLDPDRALTAGAMLEQLARDPVIVSVFGAPQAASP